MCGTIKGDIIEYDDNLPRISACNIYDNNPKHILITVIKNITCTTKKGKQE